MASSASRHLFEILGVMGILSLTVQAENVPTHYIAYSLEELKIGDRAGTTGDGLIGSKATVLVGMEAIVRGSIIAKGNIHLYDRSKVYGDVTSGGAVIRYPGDSITGTVLQQAQVAEYTIPTRSFNAGTQDVNVPLDSSRSISAGSYDTIRVLDRGTLTLSNGVYNTKAFILGNDVKLIFNFPSGEGIEVNALLGLTIGDRVRMSFASQNTPAAVSFYSNGTSDVVVGYDGVAYGAFIAPNAKAIIHDRTTYYGSVYAKRIELQPSIFYCADTIFPSVHLCTPAPGSTINTTKPRMALWYWDDKSGLDLSAFHLTINNVDRTSQFHWGADTAWWQVPQNMALVEGSVSVVTDVEDRAGNHVRNFATFFVDTTKPVLSIVKPINASITNNDTPLVKITFSDTRSGIQVSSFNCKIDGTDISSKFTVTVDSARYQVLRSQPISEGTHTLVANISDNAGNQQQTSISFSVDRTKPVVVLTSPANGLSTNQTPLSVSWKVDGVVQTTQLTETLVEGPNKILRTATDASGNVGKDSVTVTLDTHAPVVAITSPVNGILTNHTPIDVTWTADGVTQTTQVLQDLVEGSNTITRTATDPAGNAGTASVTVTLDTHPPVVAITSPANGFLTNHTPIDVTWTVDGVIQTTQLSQALTEGQNTITRSATDAAGNVGTASITVTLDTHAPEVAITSPADGFLTNHTPVDVTWTIDGIAQTTQLSQALAEGSNTITRSATDAAGNVGTASVMVTLDTQAPVVAITSPANDFLTNHTPIAVVWTVDGIIQTIQLAEALNEGVNTITRTAADAAGNVGTASVVCALDTHAPVVAITSPANGFITNTTPMVVSWTVDGVEQTTQLTQSLTEGVNTITRSATDAAGNIGTASITVTLESRGPITAIVSPVSGFISASSSVTFTVNALFSNISSSRFFIDGQDQSASFTRTNNQYAATISLNNGLHSLFVYATTAGGRSDTTHSYFKVITAPPETQVMIRGRIVNGKTFTPLPGATTRIVETGSSTTADGNGKFNLPSGGFGKYKLKIEQSGYTSAMRIVNADEGMDVEFSPILLMPLDTHKVIAPANTASSFSLCDSLVQIAIPSSALSANTPISATVYDHILQIPNEQPTYDIFLFCVDLQPNGLTFNDSITVKVANRNELSAGAEVPITYLNEQTALWEDMGTGYVTQDQKYIEFKTKHFTGMHGNFHPCDTGKCDFHRDPPHDDPPCVSCCPRKKDPTASSVSVQSGNLTEDYMISGGAALTNIDIRLVYNSSTAFPQVLINSTFKDMLISPSYNSWKLYLPGMKKQWLFYGINDQTQVGYFWNGKNEIGEDFETGLYPYGVRIGDIYMPGSYRFDMGKAENLNIYFHTPTNINYYSYGFIPLINRKHSPYGAGWAIDGITRIITKKADLSGPFPQKCAFRGIDSKTATIAPESDSKAGVDVANALGKTRGSLGGNHVCLVGAEVQDEIYWQQEGSSTYLPPYGSHDSLVFTNPGWVRKLNNGSVETYDGRGLLLNRTDKNGRTSSYLYDSFGERLLRITDETSGKYTELLYNANDVLSGVRDQFGRVTSIAIDNHGDLTAIQTLDGVSANRFIYDSTHCLVKRILTSGDTSEHYYDQWGRIIRVKNVLGKETVYRRYTEKNIANTLQEVSPDAIESFGLSTGSVPDYSSQSIHSLENINRLDYSAIDQNTDSVTYTLNSFGWISTQTDAMGQTTRYTYDIKSCGCGTASKVEYPNGLMISKEMDARGNLLSTHNLATNATTSYSYTNIKGADYVQTITNTLGQITRFEYDTIGNLTRTIAPGDDTTAITYNSLSLPQTIIDPLGRAVTTVYDSVGRVTARISPAHDTTRYAYDSYGNLSMVQDPTGRKTFYYYDIMGRLLRETDPAGNTTRYTYDVSGRLDSLVDAKNHATVFKYDAGGNLIKSTNHLGISRFYTYNKQNKLTNYTNGRGQTLAYRYDELGHMIAKVASDSTVLARFGYDEMGRMTFASNQEYAINRKYDVAGRMVQEDATNFKASDTIMSSDTIKADDFSRDFSNLVINNATVVIDGTHNFLSVQLKNGAVLKHYPATSQEVHRVEISARDIIAIDNTSKIDVTGLGYLGGKRGDNTSNVGMTDGNTTTGGSSPISGGSHGGKGGIFEFHGQPIGYAARPYDDRLNPTQPGGGGGSNGTPGFNGGGVVSLKASKVIINGLVLANGESAVNENGGAGAGGSIVVIADSISGSGSIKADGGNGISGDEEPRGGGGGRILISGTVSGISVIEALGGAYGGIEGSVCQYGPSGYVMKYNVINNNTVFTINKDYDAWDGSAVTVDNAKLIINGNHSFSRISLTNGAILTHNAAKDTSDSGAILTLLQSLYIDSTSKIDICGKGYPGGNPLKCAKTRDFQCGATGNSGGSYGGLGGKTDGNIGFMYGTVNQPAHFGSGGSDTTSNDTTKIGGAGGGRIEINAPTIQVDGMILANGESSKNGAGSGGSVYLSVGSFSGKGYISADGGWSFKSGGGGGGRVSIASEQYNFKSNQLRADGGYGIIFGKSGTVYLRHNDSLIQREDGHSFDSLLTFSNKTVVLDGNYDKYKGFSISATNCQIKITGSHYFNNVALTSSTMDASDQLFIKGNMDIKNGSTLTHSGATPTETFRCVLYVQGKLGIDNSSKIDVTAKGYLGDRYINGQWTGARTIGNAIGSTGAGAGSYGGMGDGGAIPVYGDPFIPNELGSGGSNSYHSTTSAYGGNGGGLVHIEAKVLSLNGKIYANGEGANNPCCSWKISGSGSGGCVFIKADSVYGSGNITANGAWDCYYNRNYSSGGGRIAVYADKYFSFPISNISASSSTECGGQRGTAVILPPSNDSLFILTNASYVNKNDPIAIVIDTTSRLYDGYNLNISGSGIEIRGDHHFRNLNVTNSNVHLIGNSTFKYLNSTNSNIILSGEMTVDSTTISQSNVEISGALRSNSKMAILNNSILTHKGATTTETYRCELYVQGKLEIDNTSKIEVSGKGYLGDKYLNGEWTGARTIGNAIGSTGAGAGSYGGMGDGGGSRSTYGNPFMPNELGSGGSNSYHSTTSAYGGNGGGLVHIEAKVLALNGNIYANGEAANNPCCSWKISGAGSGGCVFIKADSVYGSGSIAANGAWECYYNNRYYSSGGGRIAVYADKYFSFPISNISASSSTGCGGQRGTAVIIPPGHDSLFILANASYVNRSDAIGIVIDTIDTLYDGYNLNISGNGLEIRGNHHFGNLNLTNSNLSLLGNSTFKNLNTINSIITLVGEISVDSATVSLSNVEVNGAIRSNGRMAIVSNSTLTHRGASTTETYRCALYVKGKLEIDNSSKIEVTGKGYLGDRYVNGQWIGAHTLGNIIGSTGAGAGSYGGLGRGGASSVYGDLYYPNELGSGGGCSDHQNLSAFGGNGGGLVHIESGVLSLNGTITANGETGNNVCCYWPVIGTGSGGGIFIKSDSIYGSGSVSANSGENFYPSHYNYGGGGRIAAYSKMISNSLQFHAYGGSAGTFYLKDSLHPLGMLISDNNGNNASDNSTPIIAIPEGTVTRLTPDTLIDVNKYFSPFVKGHLVKLNYDLVSTIGAFTVTGVDTHALAVDTTNGNLFTKGNVGDHYIGVYAFDTIIVRNGARVTMPGMIFYNAILLNNGSFTSFTGTRTGYNDVPGIIPGDIRLATIQNNRQRGILIDKVNLNAQKSTENSYQPNRQVVKAATGKIKSISIFGKLQKFLQKLFAATESQKPIKQVGWVGKRATQLTTAQAIMKQPTSLPVANNVNYTNTKPMVTLTRNTEKVLSEFGTNPMNIAMLKENRKESDKPKCLAGDPMYTYDPLDRVTSMTSPMGTTQYHYDTLTGRLDRITSPEGKQFTYGYNHGQLENLTYPNGITAHYAFDDNGNLTDLDYRKNGTSVRRYQYGYDKNGMRMNMTDNDGMHDYAYDTLYQIIRATHPSVPNPLEQFSYDAVGNRLTDLTHNNYQYNELNQLTEDDSCRYAYDADGNMTEKIDKATGDTTHFVYDIENKLIEVRKPGMLAKYSYDALGRRMSKEVNGEVKQFRYDGADLILEMNGNESIVANYTFGPGIDNPLMMQRSGKGYFFLKDGLGSVTALTDSTGNMKHEYKYGIFGKITEESGDTIANQFTYTSRELDKETGNYYYRARQYSQDNGRFIQEDMLGIYGKDINFFRYSANDPINKRDPYGLIWETGLDKSSYNKGVSNTIICDGNGGITVYLGGAGSPHQSACLSDCLTAHENCHKNDALKSNPNVCKGKPYGVVVSTQDENERATSEMNANYTEVKCLLSKKGKKNKQPCGGEDNCDQTIDNRIKDLRGVKIGNLY